MSPKRSAAFKEDRRVEILHAAFDLFLVQGYDRTTLREIGEAVGLSTGALYVYYPTKVAILQAACQHEALRMQQLLTAATNAIVNDADPIAVGLHAYLAYSGGTDYPSRLRYTRANLLLCYEATRDATIAATVQEVTATWRRLVTGLLQRLQAAGRLRPGADLASLAELFLALPAGLDQIELMSGGPVDWPQIIATFSALLRPEILPLDQQSTLIAQSK